MLDLADASSGGLDESKKPRSVLHGARVASGPVVVDPAHPGFAGGAGCARRRGVTFDAVVVGGGPGGSTAAWRLARAGARVLVLDAARFPRVKLCAGWVTPTVLRDLELDPASYPHTIQSFETVSIAVDGQEHETRFGRVASHGIVRAEFDAFLLRRAAAAGATVRESARVRRVACGARGVTVETDDERGGCYAGRGRGRPSLPGGARIRRDQRRGGRRRHAGERDPCRPPRGCAR